MPGVVGAQGAQRVEDDCDVDALLQQGTGGGLDQTERGRGHRTQRQQHASEGALDGDTA